MTDNEITERALYAILHHIYTNGIDASIYSIDSLYNLFIINEKDFKNYLHLWILFIFKFKTIKLEIIKKATKKL